MKLLILLLLTFASPGFAKTHKDMFEAPCEKLWAALRDTLRNSGKYGIIGIDNSEMTASCNIGGFLTGKRINSVVLNAKGNSCEMQTQTSFSGLINHDYDDMKKRVQQSLDNLKSSPPETAATPGK